MKKRIAVLAFLLTTVLVVGCTAPAAVPHDVNDAAHYDAAATLHEELRDGTTAPAAAKAAEQTASSAVASSDPAISATRFFLLDHAEARDAALQHVEAAAEDVTHFRIELDYDDDSHSWEYDIDLHTDAAEYDIALDAQSGDALTIEAEQIDR